MIISSPSATRSSSRDKWVLASWILVTSMTKLSLVHPGFSRKHQPYQHAISSAAYTCFFDGKLPGRAHSHHRSSTGQYLLADLPAWSSRRSGTFLHRHLPARDRTS